MLRKVFLFLGLVVACCIAEVFVPAPLPCDHTINYEVYSIAHGEHVFVQGKYVVRGRYIMRYQEWGDDVEDFLIARADICKENNNKSFEVFYALNYGNGTRTCHSKGYSTYPGLVSSYFRDYSTITGNLSYSSTREGRFDQKTYTVYTVGSVDYYVDDDDRVIGTVNSVNTTRYWYSNRAPWGNFKLSSKYSEKYGGCNETRLFEGALSEYELCAASTSKAAIAAVFFSLASALVSLFF